MKNVIPVDFSDAQTKNPYNRCISCPELGVSCDGPNFLAMDVDRKADWCRLRKEYLHWQDPKWTNAYIAEQAQVSKITVDRFMSGAGGDLRISTIRSIVRVLVNGTWGQYPCSRPPEDQTPEIKRLQAIIEDLRVEHQKNLTRAHEESDRKVDYLKAQVSRLEAQSENKSKLITKMTVGLVVSLSIIILALVIDRLNPGIGFFWLG